MAVKIEIDMPKSCKACNFCVAVRTGVKYTDIVKVCTALGSPLKYGRFDTTRSKLCPLKECK